MAAGSQRYNMRGNPFQEPRQEDLTNALWRGSQQCVSHLAQLFQCRFKAQPQRIEARRHGRFDHQPADEHIQQHVSGNFVIHSVGPATAQRAFQALRHFQLEKSGFSVPIIIPPKITLLSS
jgi:hypothetical protein